MDSWQIKTNTRDTASLRQRRNKTQFVLRFFIFQCAKQPTAAAAFCFHLLWLVSALKAAATFKDASSKLSLALKNRRQKTTNTFIKTLVRMKIWWVKQLQFVFVYVKFSFIYWGADYYFWFAISTCCSF